MQRHGCAPEHLQDLLLVAPGLCFRTPCLLKCCCVVALSMAPIRASQDQSAAECRHAASGSHLATQVLLAFCSNLYAALWLMSCIPTGQDLDQNCGMPGTQQQLRIGS